MFATDEYQLLDFGSGRKLERFGPYVIDRPAPAALHARPRHEDLWAQADARFQREPSQRGRWTFARTIEMHWPIRFGPMTLSLKLTDAGQVALFPEQAGNWNWIAQQVFAAGRPLQVLNLFAHTGASTLAAAAAGAEVTHVDAVANVVTWAGRNAKASHMEDAPIRWIAEDVMKFVRRELKRGHHYDAVILDPPSFGHGPKGEPWKLADQLGKLLEMCLELTEGSREFLLLTCHSGELASAEGLLKSTVVHAPLLRQSGKLEAHDMYLHTAAGGRLHCGGAVRYSAGAQAANSDGAKTDGANFDCAAKRRSAARD